MLSRAGAHSVGRELAGRGQRPLLSLCGQDSGTWAPGTAVTQTQLCSAPCRSLCNGYCRAEKGQSTFQTAVRLIFQKRSLQHASLLFRTGNGLQLPGKADAAGCGARGFAERRVRLLGTFGATLPRRGGGGVLMVAASLGCTPSTEVAGDPAPCEYRFSRLLKSWLSGELSTYWLCCVVHTRPNFCRI